VPARLSALTLVAGALALAGCGSSSTSSTSSQSTTTSVATTTSAPSSSATGAENALSLAANPEGQLKYDKSSLTSSSGKIKIAFTNTSPLAHNVTIESASKQIVGATPTFQGATKTVALSLKPGTYKFFCSVPGHRMAGMEGTLTVK
jgi:plastocyanin